MRTIKEGDESIFANIFDLAEIFPYAKNSAASLTLLSPTLRCHQHRRVKLRGFNVFAARPVGVNDTCESKSCLYFFNDFSPIWRDNFTKFSLLFSSWLKLIRPKDSMIWRRFFMFNKNWTAWLCIFFWVRFRFVIDTAQYDSAAALTQRSFTWHLSVETVFFPDL